MSSTKRKQQPLSRKKKKITSSTSDNTTDDQTSLLELAEQAVAAASEGGGGGGEMMDVTTTTAMTIATPTPSPQSYSQAMTETQPHQSEVNPDERMPSPLTSSQMLQPTTIQSIQPLSSANSSTSSTTPVTMIVATSVPVMNPTPLQSTQSQPLASILPSSSSSISTASSIQQRHHQPSHSLHPSAISHTPHQAQVAQPSSTSHTPSMTNPQQSIPSSTLSVSHPSTSHSQPIYPKAQHALAKTVHFQPNGPPPSSRVSNSNANLAMTEFSQQHQALSQNHPAPVHLYTREQLAQQQQLLQQAQENHEELQELHDQLGQRLQKKAQAAVAAATSVTYVAEQHQMELQQQAVQRQQQQQSFMAAASPATMFHSLRLASPPPTSSPAPLSQPIHPTRQHHQHQPMQQIHMNSHHPNPHLPSSHTMQTHQGDYLARPPQQQEMSHENLLSLPMPLLNSMMTSEQLQSLGFLSQPPSQPSFNTQHHQQPQQQQHSFPPIRPSSVTSNAPLTSSTTTFPMASTATMAHIPISALPYFPLPLAQPGQNIHTPNWSYSVAVQKRTRGGGVSCHQCKRSFNDEPSSANGGKASKTVEQLYFCTNQEKPGHFRKACRKKVCIACMKRTYPHLEPLTPEAKATWICPSCQDLCSCSVCAVAKITREKVDAGDMDIVQFTQPSNATETQTQPAAAAGGDSRTRNQTKVDVIGRTSSYSDAKEPPRPSSPTTVMRVGDALTLPIKLEQPMVVEQLSGPPLPRVKSEPRDHKDYLQASELTSHSQPEIPPLYPYRHARGSSTSSVTSSLTSTPTISPNVGSMQSKKRSRSSSMTSKTNTTNVVSAHIVEDHRTQVTRAIAVSRTTPTTPQLQTRRLSHSQQPAQSSHPQHRMSYSTTTTPPNELQHPHPRHWSDGGVADEATVEQWQQIQHQSIMMQQHLQLQLQQVQQLEYLTAIHHQQQQQQQQHQQQQQQQQLQQQQQQQFLSNNNDMDDSITVKMEPSSSSPSSHAIMGNTATRSVSQSARSSKRSSYNSQFHAPLPPAHALTPAVSSSASARSSVPESPSFGGFREPVSASGGGGAYSNENSEWGSNSFQASPYRSRASSIGADDHSVPASELDGSNRMIINQLQSIHLNHHPSQQPNQLLPPPPSLPPHHRSHHSMVDHFLKDDPSDQPAAAVDDSMPTHAAEASRESPDDDSLLHTDSPLRGSVHVPFGSPQMRPLGGSATAAPFCPSNLRGPLATILSQDNSRAGSSMELQRPSSSLLFYPSFRGESSLGQRHPFQLLNGTAIEVCEEESMVDMAQLKQSLSSLRHQRRRSMEYDTMVAADMNEGENEDEEDDDMSHPLQSRLDQDPHDELLAEEVDLINRPRRQSEPSSSISAQQGRPTQLQSHSQSNSDSSNLSDGASPELPSKRSRIASDDAITPSSVQPLPQSSAAAYSYSTPSTLPRSDATQTHHHQQAQVSPHDQSPQHQPHPPPPSNSTPLLVSSVAEVQAMSRQVAHQLFETQQRLQVVRMQMQTGTDGGSVATQLLELEEQELKCQKQLEIITTIASMMMQHQQLQPSPPSHTSSSPPTSIDPSFPSQPYHPAMVLQEHFIQQEQTHHHPTNNN